MINTSKNGIWNEFLALVPPQDLKAAPGPPPATVEGDSYQPSVPAAPPNPSAPPPAPAAEGAPPPAAPADPETEVQQYLAARQQEAYQARESVIEQQAENYEKISNGGDITPIGWNVAP